jgi:uncharacterized protein with FMN-binding domain
MKKLAIVGLVVIVFVGYVLYQKQSDAIQAQRSSQTALPISPTDTPTPTASSAQSSDSPTPASTTSQTSGSFKDGTYTGSSADAFYGTVQVKATITGGKLSDIAFLQYPNDNGHSMEVSNYALPTLKQEAIQVQSAQVDAVSGATQTSQAFVQSLASALTQAQ